MRLTPDEYDAMLRQMGMPAKSKKKRRAKPVRREEPIHVSIKNYLESTLPPHWIVHHSPNEDSLKMQRIRANVMGTKSGFHDLLIMGEKDVGALLPMIVPYIWLLEVKDDDGVLSGKQKDFHKKVSRLGFPQRVVRSIDEVRAAVVDWRLPSRDLAIPK